MDATASPTQVDSQSGDPVSLAEGLRVTEPSLIATPRPPEPKTDLPIKRLSLGRRVSRRVIRFLIAACTGVVATLAWQSYGGTAKQMIASWAPQLGLNWVLPLVATSLPPGPEVTAKQPNPLAVHTASQEALPTQAAAVASIAPESVTPTAPPSPPPDLRQLETIGRDLAALRESVDQLATSREQVAQRDLGVVRQSIEQLAASQQRMADDIATLKAAEQDIQTKVSTQSRPAATSPATRKPPQPAARSPTQIPSVLR